MNVVNLDATQAKETVEKLHFREFVILSSAKDLGAPTETMGAISQRFFGCCTSSE
ncbi:MAG TPA: hypothetical protein PLN69_05230 [bacterium]|nr:hypothetical protein [bacterium]